MEKELIFTPTTFYVEAPFYLVVGDAKAYTLVFHTEKSIEGSMLLTATRADGETVADSVDFSGKVCRYTMKNAMYAAEGKLSVRVTVHTGDMILTSNELIFQVLPAANTATIESDDRYPILTKLILQTEEAVKDAESALNQLKETQNKLLPDSSLSDVGKILYLKKKQNTELQYFTAELENNSEYILDAGLLDSDTAFLEISSALFQNTDLTDPTQESCAFGLTFIPSNTDASTDYDVVAEEITASGDGYIFAFPLSACPLMEDASADTLFEIFESIQLNGEYLKEETKAVWASPEEALPGTFLDEYVISPALKLAKAYADKKDAEILTETQTALNRRVPKNKNNQLSVLVSGGEQVQYSTDEINAAYIDAYIDDITPNLTVCGYLSLEMAPGNEYEFFNPETGEKLIAKHFVSFPFDDQYELEMTCEDATPDMTLEVFKQKYPYYRVYNESRWQDTVSFLQPATHYTDTAIQKAILDSWEVAV